MLTRAVVLGLLLVLTPIASAQRVVPWRADARAYFTDITATCGIRFVHHDAPPVPPLFDGQNTRFGVGGAVSDYDRDGDLDVYVCDSIGHPNRLFRNDGAGRFTDVTAECGAGDMGYSHMALFVDLDNDGFDDLLVLNDSSALHQAWPGPQVYRNNADGTFTNVTHASGLNAADPTWGGATAGDFDHDGDLDLFLVGWYGSSTHLYRNDGGFRFTDVTDAAGARVSRERFQWTPVFVDVDGDGWQDIFCAVDFEEDYLLHNNRDGTFTDASVASGVLHVGNDMGAAVGDVDNDLDLDIYTTNVSGGEPCPDPGGCNMLYLNDGTGRFTDATHEAGVGDTAWGWGTSLADVDLDGDLDLLAVNGWQQPQWMTPAVLFINDGRGRFSDRSRRSGIDHVGNTRGLVGFDIEGDGDVDFIMFDVLGPAYVFENRTPRAGNRFLIVEPIGTASNANAVGARVYVTAGGATQMREILAGGGFYASPPKRAHFGLGRVKRVDRVRVVFPSGRQVELRDVAPDQRLRVIEP